MKVDMFPQGENGWSKWERPPATSQSLRHYQHMRIICCNPDCRLSHDFEFTSVMDSVWFRVRVNARSTAAARREARKAKP